MVKDYAYNQAKYFHKDHLGSSSVISNADGTIYEKTRYMPYGGKRGDGAGITYTAYKFTDQELDKESGLYNYDARLYDSIVGRFASVDTIVPDWYKSQAIDRYAYCINDPLKYVDPDGHLAVSTTIVVGLGIKALGIGFALAVTKGITLGLAATTDNPDKVNNCANEAIGRAAQVAAVGTLGAMAAAASLSGSIQSPVVASVTALGTITNANKTIEKTRKNGLKGFISSYLRDWLDIEPEEMVPSSNNSDQDQNTDNEQGEAPQESNPPENSEDESTGGSKGE